MPVPVFRIYDNVYDFTRKGQRLLDYFVEAFYHLKNKKCGIRLTRKLTCYSLKLAKWNGRKHATRQDVCRAFRQYVERAFRRAAYHTLKHATREDICRAFKRTSRHPRKRSIEPYVHSEAIEPYVHSEAIEPYVHCEAGPKVVVLWN